MIHFIIEGVLVGFILHLYYQLKEVNNTKKKEGKLLVALRVFANHISGKLWLPYFSAYDIEDYEKRLENDKGDLIVYIQDTFKGISNNNSDVLLRIQALAKHFNLEYKSDCTEKLPKYIKKPK